MTYQQLFTKDIDVKRTCEGISAALGIPVVAGQTLVFLQQMFCCHQMSSTKGSMQSLCLFIRKKNLQHAIRTSLENFGKFAYIDKETGDAVRHVGVIPLYALSNL